MLKGEAIGTIYFDLDEKLCKHLPAKTENRRNYIRF